MSSRTLVITSRVSVLEIETPTNFGQRVGTMPACTLKWRQKQLWVKSLKSGEVCALASLQHEDWLIDCLKHSSVERVCLDPTLGAEGLRRWAEACEKADKPAFVRLPPQMRGSRRKKTTGLSLERVLGRAIAALLLLILSPTWLSLILLLGFDSPEPIFIQQWRIGERGRLFRSIAFCTRKWNRQSDQMQSTPLREWVRQTGLEPLPQLINVMRGEMELMDAIQVREGLSIAAAVDIATNACC
jgi:Bacterial sugar transferase